MTTSGNFWIYPRKEGDCVKEKTQEKGNE